MMILQTFCWRRTLLILCCGLLVVGCGKKNKETQWGIYQEPIEAGELPPSQGLSELSVAWRGNVGNAGDDGFALLHPVMTDDGVFAASRSGRVNKLDRTSGKVIWSHNIDSDVFAGVGVGEGLVLVALDSGVVVALDAVTGDARWRAEIGRLVSAIPVAGIGRVIVRTVDGYLQGLDALSGEVVWSLQRDVPGFSMHGDSSPVFVGETVVTGLSNGKLMANAAANGRAFWETDLSFVSGANELERLADVDAPPVVAGDSLYAATYQGDVVAVNLETSTVSWRQDISTRLPMAVDFGQAYVVDSLGGIHALNTDDGAIIWSQKGFQGRGVSNPVVMENRLMAGDAEGNVHLMSIANGTLVQTLRVAKGAITSLVASGAESDTAVALTAKGDIALIKIDAE